MAKSLRSKTKQAFRSKKRESGIYAATEAARLDRLHAKLAATVQKQKQSDDADDLGENPEGMQISEIEEQDDVAAASAPPCQDDMVLEGPNQKQSTKEATRISTHGPRGSRREDWRRSRGLDPIPKRNGMNRQGGLAARRKAGRPSRRR